MSSRPSSTISRSVVLMQDAAARAEIVTMLAAILGYQGTDYSTNEQLSSLVPSLVPDIAVVVVDFVESAQFAELFSIMAQKNLSVPLIVVAPDVAPLVGVTDLNGVYACAQYPLAEGELAAAVNFARRLFTKERQLKEEIVALANISKAVAAVQARFSTELRTIEQARAWLENLASSNGRSLSAEAQILLKADQAFHPRVSARSKHKK